MNKDLINQKRKTHNKSTQQQTTTNNTEIYI